MKWIIAVLVILSAVSAVIAADAPSKRPTWCQPGYECIPTTELADATVHTIVIERELAILKARKKPALGLRYSCGIGISATVTESYDVHAFPAVSCHVGFGW